MVIDYILLIIIVFVIGFFAGMLAENSRTDEVIQTFNSVTNEIRGKVSSIRENLHWWNAQIEDHIAPKIRDILKELEGGKDNGIAKTDTRND